MENKTVEMVVKYLLLANNRKKKKIIIFGVQNIHFRRYTSLSTTCALSSLLKPFQKFFINFFKFYKNRLLLFTNSINN